MIEFKNVYKSFKEQGVLRGINLKIPKGKVTAILGASGSGKTVLLRHMIGFLQPDSGKVIIDGVDINSLSRTELYGFRKRFGMLFQNGALFDSMSVIDNVSFPISEHRRDFSIGRCYEIAKAKLKLVGLEGAEDKMPSLLSGGMNKRVGLARALALDPEILLYDEPTTGLDPIMTRAVDDLIVAVQERVKATSVLISHDIKSVFRVADYVAMLNQGVIVEFGDRDSVWKSNHPVVKSFLSL